MQNHARASGLPELTRRFPHRYVLAAPVALDGAMNDTAFKRSSSKFVAQILGLVVSVGMTASGLGCVKTFFLD